MTHRLDVRLAGREPEFMRCSTKPHGIGAGMMPHVAQTLIDLDLDLPGRMEDAPSALRHGKRLLPLGSYLHRKLRKQMGFDEKTPQSVIEKQQEEMRPLREAAFDNSRSLKEEVIDHEKGSVASMLKKAEIYKQRKKL